MNRMRGMLWNASALSVSLAVTLSPAAYAACAAGSICVTQTTDAGNSAVVGSFSWAIAQANAGGNRTISFDTAAFAGAGNTLTLTGTTVSTPRLSAGVTIDGSSVPGLTINGSNQREILLIRPDNTAVPISVTVRNVTLINGKAKGGNGATQAFGAGGGMGAGGAIFVGDGVALTAENVSLQGNTAQGGSGGTNNTAGRHAGGGGGGLNGGNGGVSGQDTSGGGGGGTGAGANGNGMAGGGPAAGAAGSASSSPAAGGAYSGGGGASGLIGGSSTVGGAGGWGGGGGGGAAKDTGAPGSANGDYAAHRGGTGGFGGGGGGGANEAADTGHRTPGGNGGFGGGAGSGRNVQTGTGQAQAGFGGGPSNGDLLGGAGAGFGGAIFVENGGSITLVGNGIVSGGSATGGTTSGFAGGTGLGLGSGFYLHGTSALNVRTALGQTQTISNVIASDGFNLPANAANADPAGDGVDGGVIHTGAGTLVLRGANSYAGGTTVHGGIVNAAADNHLGHVSGHVTLDGGTLQWGATFNTARGITVSSANGIADTQAFNAMLSGVVDGAGAVIKQGAGVLTLTGTNTYTGGTAMNAGTVSVARDANLGAAAGGLAFNGGTLQATASMAMNRAMVFNGNGTIETVPGVTVTNAGVGSGVGALVKRGTGQLILTGDNDYAGGTTIAAGTLQVGNGTTGGSITGNVTDNAVLVFHRSDAMDFAGTVTGPGSLTQAGSGVVTLTGVGSSVGNASVTAGTLNLAQAGAFATTGNYLTGSGATTRVAADATLIAGGNFTQGAGSMLEVALDNTSPVITAVSANLAGALNVTGFGTNVPNRASALSSTLFPVIHTTGGIANDFASVHVDAVHPVDYLTPSGAKSADGLDYNLALGLTWFAGPTSGNGVFTLAGSADTFDVDVALSDQSPSAVPWNGTALTKSGLGTLILSAPNTYSGVTTIASGTLQLGNGGAAGSVPGDIVDNATLLLNRADTWALPGTVSGTGSLIQAGAGTSILMADNTFTGGTTVAAGTLQLGDGGTTGAIVNDVTDNARLAFNRADDVSFGGVISGSGSVAQIGSGTTTLTGANTYAGGTTISAGTLQIGDGGTRGSIIGDITDNAALVFNRSDALSLAGVINGSGAVRQQGPGTTVLSAANGYAGGSVISAGTLSVGADNNLGDPAGTVTLGGGTLRLTSDFASARPLLIDAAGGAIDVIGRNKLTGTIDGAGGLAKLGDGVLIIDTTATYAGLTHVAAGSFVVGDSAHDGAELEGNGGVDIDAGASFGGYGQVIGQVNNAGTLGVGNALAALTNGPDADFTIVGNLVNAGTVTLVNAAAGDHLNVSGTYVSAGGNLAMDAVLNEGGAATPSDRLTAQAVTLAGGATRIVVHSVGGTGAVTQGDGIALVNVLDRSASAAGAFVLATRAVAGPYEYRLFQGGIADASDGQWYLRSAASAVSTRSQGEPVPPGSSPQTPPAPPPTPGSPITPLAAVLVPIFRPEVGAYLANRAAFTSLLLQTLHERQGDPQYGRDDSADADSTMGKMWLRVLGGSTRTEAAGGLVDAHGGRSLLQFGGDLGSWNLADTNDRLHVGGMLGRANTSADVTAQFNPATAHGHTDGYIAGAYATWFANNEQRLGSYLDAWTQLGWFDNEVRSSPLPSVDYNSRSWAASLEYGYGFALGQHWVLEPQTQVIHLDYHADAVTDGAGTRVQSSGGNTTLGRLGVRLYPLLASPSSLRPFVEANWWHGGRRDTDDFNGVSVADAVPKNRYQTNVGFQARIGQGWVLWARAGSEWGNSQYRRAEGQLGVKVSW